MERQALGLIETVGLTAAVEAADIAVKTANVNLVGYELTKGGGMVTVKIEGEVGSVQVSAEAARAAASRLNGVWAVHVIPRPSADLSGMIRTVETAGGKAGTPEVHSAPVCPPMREESIPIPIEEEPASLTGSGSPEAGGDSVPAEEAPRASEDTDESGPGGGNENVMTAPVPDETPEPERLYPLHKKTGNSGSRKKRRI